MLGKAKRLIESFWVKPSNWSKLTKHRMTVRSEAAVGKSEAGSYLQTLFALMSEDTHKKS